MRRTSTCRKVTRAAYNILDDAETARNAAIGDARVTLGCAIVTALSAFDDAVDIANNAFGDAVAIAAADAVCATYDEALRATKGKPAKKVTKKRATKKLARKP